MPAASSFEDFHDAVVMSDDIVGEPCSCLHHGNVSNNFIKLIHILHSRSLSRIPSILSFEIHFDLFVELLDSQFNSWWSQFYSFIIINILLILLYISFWSGLWSSGCFGNFFDWILNFCENFIAFDEALAATGRLLLLRESSEGTSESRRSHQHDCWSWETI